MFPANKEDKTICTRCLLDSTVPNIRFDEAGVCNYCHSYDRLDQAYPIDADGSGAYGALVQQFKEAGKDKPFDVILGISGGADSSYTLWELHRQGVRPLAVHFDDGFRNPVAVQNIERVCGQLGVKVETVKADEKLSNDIKRSILKASVPDIDLGFDIGVAAALYGKASEHDLKHIVIGFSFRTEGIGPLDWFYTDGNYLLALQRKFGTVRMPPWESANPGFTLGIQQVLHYLFVKRIKTLPVLNYLPYHRAQAEQLITQELGWQSPGQHYGDDTYQAFMQYVQREKFGFDKRLYRYAALIRSGQLTRAEAQEQWNSRELVDASVLPPVLEKLGLSEEVFEFFMQLPNKTFRDYPSNYRMLKRFKWLLRLADGMGLVPKGTYDKFFG